MKKSILNQKYKLFLLAGYVFLVLPIIFSMYYSVPASDDFIYGTFVSSNNIIINALAYVRHMSTQGCCRWLVFFFQKCVNPLNIYSLWGMHVGHLYGLSAIIVFCVSVGIIFYCVRYIASILITEDKYVDVLTLLVMAVLLSTYYYSEVYNWYTGGTAYAIPFAFTLLTYITTIRYFKNEDKRKNYALLFVYGLLPVTNEFLCVPIGIFYLCYILDNLKYQKSTNEKIKDVVPLIYYIIMGCTAVLVPGTLNRRNQYEISTPFWRLLLQVVINLVVRIKDIVIYHPLTVILLILIFAIGVKTKNQTKYNIWKYIFVFTIAAIGAILPYCVGRGTTTTYMDVRMYYIFDYILLLGMCLIMYMIGSNFAIKYDVTIDKVATIRWSIVIIMFSYLMLVPQNLYLKIPQIDIVKKSGLIKESYAFWDGILTEIENSDEKDVVLVRDKEPEWTQYFLWVGIEADNVYDQSFDAITPTDEIMINSYYKKKSIVLKYLSE